ncbi:MAG: hypothetical protein PWP23_681 [Candidatus Sumerlaeota bacterium]|nr:hypothetical protein [Candidatus Sumerlaeota bacterium]
MTEPQDPKDKEPGSAREEGDWTWERPEDGAPVYGADEDEPVAFEPPTAKVEEPSSVPPEQTPPPPAQPAGVGPARTPEEAMAARHVAQPAEPPQPGQYPPPPEQWAPNWQPDYYGVGYPENSGYAQAQGYPPPPANYPPSPYGPVAPGPAFQPVPQTVPNSSTTMLTLSLWSAFLGLIFAICCQPIGIIAGGAGCFMAWQVRRNNERGSDQHKVAGHLLWVNVVTILVSFILLLLTMAIQILMPDLAEQMNPFLQ